MSISFESGGLITRGFGESHRIVTRGMSVRFDFGGRIGEEILKDYDIFIDATIIKDSFYDIQLQGSLKIIKTEEISLNVSIQKELIYEINIDASIDNSKMFEILDEI
jgi:hypothetical protein